MSEGANSDMPIRVIIVTGFLGGGKTSFLRHLLPVCGEVGLRPALIINEVGAVDVDGELLADLHLEQVKLVGGCVCCTLQAQLKETLFDVVEQQRGDCIIIECSGLSNPVDVLNVLTIPALISRVVVSHLVCLVDATRMEKIVHTIELAKTQIATADLVLVNKADQVDAGRRAALQRVATGLAPQAAVQWTTYGNPGADLLRQLLTDPAPVKTWEQAAAATPRHDHPHTHSLPASFCTLALPLPARLSRAQLQQLLQALPANVIRAKGFARLDDGAWQVLHRVYDAIDIAPYAAEMPSCGAVLVCIGQHLEAAAIQRIIALT